MVPWLLALEFDASFGYGFVRGRFAELKEMALRLFGVYVVEYLYFVAAVRLKAVGHFDAADGGAFHFFGAEEIDHPFYVAYGVDVSVDVEVCVDGAARVEHFGAFEAYAPHGGDGRRAVWDEAVRETSVGELCEVGGLARCGVDECPNACGVAVGGSIGVCNGEVAVGKLAVEAVYPSFYAEHFVGARQGVHLYD